MCAPLLYAYRGSDKCAFVGTTFSVIATGSEEEKEMTASSAINTRSDMVVGVAESVVYTEIECMLRRKRERVNYTNGIYVTLMRMIG
jgi:hypothetical protein